MGTKVVYVWQLKDRIVSFWGIHESSTFVLQCGILFAEVFAKSLVHVSGGAWS